MSSQVFSDSASASLSANVLVNALAYSLPIVTLNVLAFTSLSVSASVPILPPPPHGLVCDKVPRILLSAVGQPACRLPLRPPHRPVCRQVSPTSPMLACLEPCRSMPRATLRPVCRCVLASTSASVSGRVSHSALAFNSASVQANVSISSSTSTCTSVLPIISKSHTVTLSGSE